MYGSVFQRAYSILFENDSYDKKTKETIASLEQVGSSQKTLIYYFYNGTF
jgi:hypothetical protein